MAKRTPQTHDADPKHASNGAERSRSSRSLLKRAAVVLVAAILGIIGVTTALAATTYTPIETTVSPSSTIINLFDYRVTLGTPNWNEEVGYRNTGINLNHDLKFGSSLSGNAPTSNTGQMNAWTGRRAGVLQGIVANRLGSDGYPVLSGDRTKTGGSTQSLGYLFNDEWLYNGTESENNLYKKAYTNVQGLLQVNEQGYYYYASAENYAYFTPDSTGTSGSFTVYDTDSPVVTYDGVDQFFPFNSPSQANGQGTTSPNLDHYLGLSLTTRFIQNYDGYTNAKRDTATTFEFSGDDDVWIFIDNVLVADLGGVHDARSVTIDFVNGTVTIDAVYQSGYATAVRQTTYFSDIFAGTGVEMNDAGRTLANGTTHTLKFFYLERGGNASNLSLKYNLTDTPATGIFKVDQYGDALSGATFAVYKAQKQDDGTYEYIADDGTVVDAADADANETTGVIATGDYTITPPYVGTTDANGEMVFVDKDGMAYSMKELETLFGSNFILREIVVPSGYRTVASETWLYIENNKLQCDDPYTSGVWASPNALVTANNTLYVADKDQASQAIAEKMGLPTIKDENNDDVYYIDYYDPSSGSNGTLFGVVLKRDGAESGVTNLQELTFQGWDPLYGNETQGYTVLEGTTSGTQLTNAIAAAKQQIALDGSTDGVVFSYSASGMQVLMENLPGEPTRYYTYMVEQENPTVTSTDPQYLVAYYYTTADSIEGATVDNTVRVASHEDTTPFSGNSFVVQWGSTIQVPNIENRLIYQKLDGEVMAENPDAYLDPESDALVNGAWFALYSVNEVDDVVYYTATDGAQVVLGAAATDGTGIATVGDEKGTYTTSTNGVVTVTLDNGATYTINPVDVGETNEAKDYAANGTNYFGKLGNGWYVLREISAPEGYEVNPTAVKVIVNDSGVYANAGTTTDGVNVGNGPGYLAATMNNFASRGSIDESLAWIKCLLQQKTSEKETFASFGGDDEDTSTWDYVAKTLNEDGTTDDAKGYGTDTVDNPNTAMVTYLTYDPEQALYFEYRATSNQDKRPAYGNSGPSQAGEGTIRLFTDTGWSALAVYQDYWYGSQQDTTGNSTYYQDLGGRNLTSLFSNSTFVQVADSQPLTVALDVYKQLDDGAELTFEKELEDGTTDTTNYRFDFAFVAADDATEDAIAKGNVVLTAKTDGGVATEPAVSTGDTIAEVNTDGTLVEDEESDDTTSDGATTGEADTDEATAEETQTELWVTDGSKLTFHKAGTYTFYVRETTPDNTFLDSDQTVYRVTYVVEQADDGTLSLATVDEDGKEIDNPAWESTTDIADFDKATDEDFENAIWTSLGTIAGGFFENYTLGSVTLTKVTDAADGQVAPDKTFTFQFTATAPETPETEDEDQDQNILAQALEFFANAFGLAGQADEAPRTLKSYNYTLATSEGTKEDTIASGETIKMKADNLLTIDGIPDGYTVTFTEVVDDMPAGFEQTGPTDDNGNVIDATTTIEASEVKNLTVTNTYTATMDDSDELAKTVIPVTKAMTGRTLADGDSFTFAIGAASWTPIEGVETSVEMPVPENGSTLKLTATADDDGNTSMTGSFGTITFRAPGTYRYTVTEVQPGDTDSAYLSGVTYSTDRYTVIFDVTDDGEGNLKVASVTANGETLADDTVVFINSYNEAHVDPSVEKTLTSNSGSDSMTLAKQTFSFTMYEADGTTPIETKQNNAEGDVDFTRIIYTKDDLVDDDGNAVTSKVFTYVFKENVPEGLDETGTLNGMTYDTRTVTLTVRVTLNDDDTLTATPTYTIANADGTTAAGNTFANTYTATPTSVNISVQKTLANRDFLEGESYSFQLTGATSGTVVRTATVTADSPNGIEPFATLAYETVGTRTYTVREVTGNKGGLSYDSSVYSVTVNVTDDGKGALQSTVSVTKNGEAYNDTTLAFTNTAKSVITTENPAQGAIIATKTLTGRAWQPTDSFTFQLTGATDDTPMPSVTTKTIQTAGQQAVFSGIEYQQAGTYTYKLTEVVDEDDKLGGIAYDTTEYTVTVTVVGDAATGGLAIGSVTYSNGTEETSNAAFTNTYTVEPQRQDDSQNIGFSKVLTGRDWLETDKFTFLVTALNGAPLVDGDGATVDSLPLTVDSESTTQLLPLITYSAAGTYQYTIEETSGNGNGITVDPTKWTVTVTVTDNLDGTLTVSEPVYSYQATSTKTRPEFKNQYNVNDRGLHNAVNLQFTKTVTNRVQTSGIFFSFTVTPADDASAEKLPGGTYRNGELNENGTADLVSNDGTTLASTFGAVTFDIDDAGNTYTWTVAEDTNHMPAGYTATVTKHTISVSVADDKTGNLDLTIKVDDEDEFTSYGGQATERPSVTLGFENAYGTNPKSVAVSDLISIQKTLTGRDMVEGEFSFELLKNTDDRTPVIGEDGKPVTGSNDENGKVTMSPVVYTEPGTYTYVLREVQGTADHVAYDTEDREVTVVVRDNGAGELVVESSDETADGITFKNVYLPPDPMDLGDFVKLAATKCTTGHSMEEGLFSFTVTPDDSTNPEGELKSSDKLPEGTYVNGAAADGGTAQLFSKTDATKTLATALNGIKFTVDDIGNTYGWTISEEALAGEAAAYTSETGVYELTVTVNETFDAEDNPVLDLDVQLTLDDEPVAITEAEDGAKTAALAFSNSYYATTGEDGEGAASLTVKKTLTGRPLIADEFEFQLVDKNGTMVDTATNTADGTVTFGPLAYNTKSLAAMGATATIENGKDVYKLHYTAQEVTEGLADRGVSPESASFGVDVVVTDNGDGTMIAVATAAEGAGFENVYSTGDDISLKLKGYKDVVIPGTLVGPADVAGAYTFTIDGVGPDGTAAPLPESLTTVNNAEGDVEFGPITFALEILDGVEPNAQGERTKLFTYTITESGLLDGVTNDAQNTKVVTVLLKDNAKGELTFQVNEGARNPAFTFTNTYGVNELETSVTDQIEVTKTLSGRELKAGEFSFQLVDGNGQVAATGTNDADGKVELTSLVFDEPGEYHYTLSEVDPEMDGVTYDTAVYQVTVTVTDNGNGTLSAEHAIEGTDDAKAATFSNSYSPLPVIDPHFGLNVVKTLQGRDWTDDDDFTVVAVADADNPDPSAVSDPAEVHLTADRKTGNFGHIVFMQPGTYRYTVYEVAPDEAEGGMAYSDALFQVVYVVSDDGEGHLVYTMTVNDEEPASDAAMEFVNVYTKPAKPEEPKKDDTGKIIPVSTGGGATPTTGDPLSILTSLLLAAGGAGAAGAGALIRRDKSKPQGKHFKR